ncbi:Histidine biosynthesis bifunctional protein hisB [Rhizopus stolonifer]|uniref:Imidazole glycerol phosphate synthase hisHF n=1 Tax=Rhizopus stolonifer TaxID=4846 RepID=A0A367KX77_RHIST|nr:Histidine biosynthesis bifunctional protein hisB [Rhizopus stolonifer]
MSTRYQNLSLHEESNINTTSNSSQVQQQSDLINAFGELDDEHTRLLISEPSSSLAVLPVSTDGVFSNISARPDCERVQEMPPTYQEAALDATPSYWQTTIITPTGMDDIVLVEGMPVDSVFAFVWNLMISASFQIIGFMLTYLLHTSHAAKFETMPGLYMLNYGAGNVRSLVNAVNQLGFDVQVIQEPSDIGKADKLLFPGVGDFGFAMRSLRSKGYDQPLKEYVQSGRPFMAICVGMQSLFEGSEESDEPGLGIIPGKVQKFDATTKAVPHMGWSNVQVIKEQLEGQGQPVNFSMSDDKAYYFVHSYAARYTEENKDWTLTTSQYGNEMFISTVQKGNVLATQFHPEKSGYAGLNVLKSFLTGTGVVNDSNVIQKEPVLYSKDRFTKRIIACLDVRANDNGDLVVTKGDQYDVRETEGDKDVRNLGKPVDLAKRYFEEGADEVTFLNITSFRNHPLGDTPMLEVLKRTSETVFVPLTIGGGIRDMTDPDGTFHPAFKVAGEYFRSGADKISIGSDAVYCAEKFYENNQQKTGTTAIETISDAYGSQAVVISVDPRRVYVKDPSETTHHVVKNSQLGPNGEEYCWYQCTVMGGREGRDLDVIQLVTACEKLGAGEILLNCMDRDGTNSGFEHELIDSVKKAVSIPVVASSGAGCVEHFEEVFEKTNVEAALAAGIFHRKEVPIQSVKEHLKKSNVPVRPIDSTIL